MTTLEEQYQECNAVVAEKEQAYKSAMQHLVGAGVAIEDFEGLLATLPPEVATERDDLICNYAGRDYMDEMYLRENLAQLGGTGKAKMRVQETLHKLSLLEIALGAEIELEDAYHALDTVVRQMPAQLRNALTQQEAGQLQLL